MKEVVVSLSPEIHTEIHEVRIPEPGPRDVVIKVEVAGSNVKGKMLLNLTTPHQADPYRLAAS